MKHVDWVAAVVVSHCCHEEIRMNETILGESERTEEYIL